LDGTAHKKIWDLEWKESDGVPIYFMMHRDVFYYIVEGEKGSSLLAYSLQSKKVKIIYQADLIDCLYALGNSLYFREMINASPRESIRRYDLLSGESELLQNCGNVLPMQEKYLVYYFDASQKEYTHDFFLAEQDGVNAVRYELPEEGNYKVLASDGNYLFVYENMDFGDKTIRVYEAKTQKKIAVIPIPLKGEHIISCTTDGKLLAFDDLEFQFFYCDIAAIGTPDFQWYQVEKVN
jgi:hypothetical protein